MIAGDAEKVTAREKMTGAVIAEDTRFGDSEYRTYSKEKNFMTSIDN